MQPTRITCVCGKTIKATLYENHLKTKQHINKLRPKKTDTEYKKTKYEENKDLNNCCSRCLKVDIPPCFYLPVSKLCLCCDEIMKGGNKTCKICKQTTPVESMERPYLYYCKTCAAIRCAKPLACECGATISLSTKSKHVRSKKHLAQLEQNKKNTVLTQSN